MTTNRFNVCAVGVVALAFALREWFVVGSILPNPEQGDVVAYVRYALHLLLDGTFSQAGGVPNPPPDAFRGPGYPIFLAVVQKVVGWDSWYSAVRHVQAFMGACTVAGVIMLGRRWMSSGWALVAGLLLAIQPHSIAATGAMLVEVLFGMLIVAALCAGVLALDRRSTPLAALAGAILGYGYLVNPVIGAFPFLAAALFWRAGATRQGLFIVGVALIFIGGWSARNAVQGLDGGGRAQMNVVQGSWPSYHDSWKRVRVDPMAARDMAIIEAETNDLSKGNASPMLSRLGKDPARYLKWYLLQKPYLLWDWNVRVGAGGVHTIEVEKSPLSDSSAMKMLVEAQRLVNPILFVLSVLGIFVALRRLDALQVALFVLYVTAVHMVFQAEPRYAIAYRGPQILMAMTCLWWLARRIRTSATERSPVP